MVSDAPTLTPAARPWLLPTAIGVVALLLGVGLGWLVTASFAGDSEDGPDAGAAPVGFAQDMIVHHAQGVEMAEIVLTQGTDPAIRKIALTILTDQTREIGQMTAWLDLWGQPVESPDAPMTWMGHDTSDPTGHDMSGHSGHGTDAPAATAPAGTSPAATNSPVPADEPVMPGMATDAEMARLRSLHGAEADTFFIQLMLRHHEGGLHMMTFAADPANVSQEYVRELAGHMDGQQTDEITLFTKILTERNAQPLPMN
ncbi:DUF305 domain-containing protein [Gordonia pseudamarae]|uniref:DUF305 domain-containing protein n=1 Tax=Gordonia pseudamarae TaxID=2831662 RepID=A0ABX6INL3_9ACTN|nr:DUF305 domain-containing protein [Gordonia sp. (in: high G+C Gram-positive bacteria)]QHN28561.1 DUF305 domain-containing protein [Gordonia pseudamarae]QHN37429.1 DUF305 domain-containing protein [Gordonia pseudamarae]